MQWAMRKLGVEEWLVLTVMSMYCIQVQKQLLEQFMVTVETLR